MRKASVPLGHPVPVSMASHLRLDDTLGALLISKAFCGNVCHPANLVHPGDIVVSAYAIRICKA